MVVFGEWTIDWGTYGPWLAGAAAVVVGALLMQSAVYSGVLKALRKHAREQRSDKPR